MKRTPIIITGHEQSGMTALCDLINIDGRALVTNECWQFAPELEGSEEIYINLKSTRTIHRLVDLFERHGVDWNGLLPYNIRRSLFNDWLDDILPESIQYIGDKTGMIYLYAMPTIVARLPSSAKLIIMIRDGRDLITMEHWKNRAWPESNDMLESWLNCMMIIRDYALENYKSRTLLIKYEDLV